MCLFVAILPVDTGAELNSAYPGVDLGCVSDLAKRSRGRTRIPDVEERVIQEVQRHQSHRESHSFSDSNLLVDAHVEDIERLMTQIQEPCELTRSGGRSEQRGIYLARSRRCIYRRDVADIGNKRGIREVSSNRAQCPLQLFLSKATEEIHARLRKIVNSVASTIEEQWMAGGDSLAPAYRPAANDTIQHTATVKELASLAERQIIGPIGIEHMPPVEW